MISSLPALPTPAQVSLFSIDLQGIQLAVFDLDVYGQHLDPPYVQALGQALSISHSGPYLALALGPQGWKLGVDCQQLISRSPSSYLLAHFHPREAAQVTQARRQGQAAEAFTRLWTRKEAFLKATGLGLSRPLAQDYLGLETQRVASSIGTFQLFSWDRICPDLYLSLAYCPK